MYMKRKEISRSNNYNTDMCRCLDPARGRLTGQNVLKKSQTVKI